MFFSDDLWTIAFILTSGILAGSAIVFWVGLREYFTSRNWRVLLFGIGLTSIAYGYLAMNLYNLTVLPWHIIFPFMIGFGLTGISLVLKKWQYVAVIFVFLPLIIPFNSPFLPLVTFPILIVALLAYKNFCILSCNYKDCKKQRNENIEWATLFTLFFLSLFLQALLRGGYYNYTSNVLLYFLLAIRASICAILFYHILKCIRFSVKEKLLLSLAVGLTLVTVLLGFSINRLFTTFTEKSLKNHVLMETKAAEKIAQRECLSGVQLSKRITAKDITLNDLADQILVETGIRTTLFYGNERIAAVPSAKGSGRMIGTKIEDSNIKETVLEKGEDYVGKIDKGGDIAIAAYAPVFENGKVVGMVGSGVFITDLYSLQKTIFYQTIVGMGIVFVFFFIAAVYNLPKISKKLDLR